MPEWLAEWWPAIAVIWMTVVSGFVGWVQWSFKQQFATRDSVEKGLADERAQRREIQRRVDRQELMMDSLPTKDQIHELQLNIVKLSGRLDATSQELKSVGAIAKRLEDFQFDRGKAS